MAAVTLNSTVFDYDQVLTYYKTTRPPASVAAAVALKNEDSRVFLGKTDSIHDFDDKDGRVPSSLGDAIWNKVSTNLFDNLLTKPTLPARPDPSTFNNDFSPWLKANSNQSITASKVEDQTVSYFEQIFESDLKVQFTKKTTYRAILNVIATQQGTLNERILRAAYAPTLMLGRDYEYLILDVDMEAGEDWNVDYSIEDKITIGLFFLNFFFPPPEDDPGFNTKLATYITFDANSNVPSKIFGLLDQVINLITPLNIADSATTGETHLAIDKGQKKNGVKNTYAFPFDQPGESPDYHYTSNIYTRDETRIQLRLNNRDPTALYNEKTKYDFKIFIDPPPAPTPGILTFDYEHKSGPSVTYLSYLINGSNNGLDSKMVDLTDIRGPALLFDIKRSGDWEQCNAAYKLNKYSDAPFRGRVILCSIDRLCALYSRCIGQNTILHYGTHLKLFRFPGLSMSDEEIAAAGAKLSEKMAALAAQDDVKKRELSTKLIKFFGTPPQPPGLGLPTPPPLQGELPPQPPGLGPGSDFDTLINTTIMGFKPGNPIGNWFIDLAKQLLLKTRDEIWTIVDLPATHPDGPTFFSGLSKISGQNVSKYNSETFGPYFENFKSQGKRKFFYYDHKFLSDLRDLIVPIYNFNESKTPRSLEILNYKDEMEKKGLFDSLLKLADLLPNIFTKDEIIEIKADADEIFNDTYSEPYSKEKLKAANVGYFTSLKTGFNTLIGTPLVEMDIGGGGKKTTGDKKPLEMDVDGKEKEGEVKMDDEEGEDDEQEQEQEEEEEEKVEVKMEEEEEEEEDDEEEEDIVLDETQKKNVIENLRNNLLDEFLIFTTELSEILTFHISIFLGDKGSSQLSFSSLQNELTNPDTHISIKTSDISFIKNSIINFLTTCSKMINEAKRLTNVPDNIVFNFLFLKFLLSSFFVIDIVGSEVSTYDSTNDYSQQELDIHELVKAIKTIIGESQTESLPFIISTVDSYFDEFSVESKTSISIDSDLEKEFQTNLQMSLRLILRFCFKENDSQDDPSPIKFINIHWNVLLLIFVFFQNYFKYIIVLTPNLKVGKKKRDSFVDYPEIGYYKGLLNFHHDVQIIRFFNTMAKTTFTMLIKNQYIGSNTSWENDENLRVFDNFYRVAFNLIFFVKKQYVYSKLDKMSGQKRIRDTSLGGRKKQTKKTKHIQHKRRTKRKT
jgi:hypothetical protein